MPDRVWTIKSALDWCQGYLERKGDASPRLSAEWLLSEACSLRRVELYVNFDRPLSSEERAILRDWVARRGAGEPLQYITGEVPFRHIAVKVRKGVLIPRPETEVLVSEALAMLPARRRRHAVDSTITQSEFEDIRAQNAAKSIADETSLESSLSSGEAGATDPSNEQEKAFLAKACAELATSESDVFYVADICTGTGCIACSIAYEDSRARVIACDIAPEAIAAAKENVALLDLKDRVAVLQGNLGEPVGERFIGKLSLVVSNPPYIPTSVLGQLSPEVVDHEPRLALDGGCDGLDLYRPLAQWAFRALAPGGAFAVELHETCLDIAAEFAIDLGFREVRIVRDLANRPRVLAARKPSENAE